MFNKKYYKLEDGVSMSPQLGPLLLLLLLLLLSLLLLLLIYFSLAYNKQYIKHKVLLTN